MTSPSTSVAPDLTRPYQGYVYAYPHKTSYRPLTPRPRLSDVWAAERRDALFLYLHVPFCEMRCGFCNLFTRTGAPEELTTAYLDALERQADAVRDALGEASFATAAFGGGTPTYLTAAELERLCDLAGRFADLGEIPLSVETSPATATADRLTVLAERGAARVSIGVQSFVDAEARAAVRPQKRAEVESALDRIRAVGFDTLNIDLIYGIDGQTPESWRHSLDAAMSWEPEELYLYPLYVRPLTGLGRQGRSWDDQRLELYRIGRDHLLGLGYEQVSMRMFRRPVAETSDGGTTYCCQTDGMVGLGCGARSYTEGLHYSFEYAVGASAVRGIIDEYVRTRDFGDARVGFALDDDERRRRHLLQSLLQASGLRRADYRRRFGTDPAADFATELAALADRGWLDDRTDVIRLTPEGLAYSDAIGPALFSPRARTLMDTYEAR
ncbi:STM4012 family radical SAM protein [Actinoallomurus sp. NPDC052274]|uniref:STM4012 family radical SAM protein n=1 Tax=Actinoallomurus sp. NPDC052274 TaxID=3155420 RepID=UPI00343CA069